MTYEDLARSISALRTGRGTHDQCVATARLIMGLFHYEFEELARALRREDNEAKVFDDTSKVVIRLNGTWVTVIRFAGQAELRIEFTGFGAEVVPPDQREQKIDVGCLSITEAQVSVRQSVEKIGTIWREELATRHPKKA